MSILTPAALRAAFDPAQPPGTGTPALLQDLLDSLESRIAARMRAFEAPRFSYRPGEWYGPVGGSTGNANLSQNRLTVCALWLPESTPIDRIGINVTTGAAGATIRLGLYTLDAYGRPVERLLEAGSVDASTAGEKEIVIAQTLPAGGIGLGAVAQGSSSAQATCLTNGSTAGVSNSTLGDAAVGAMSHYEFAVSGALPLTFTRTGTSNQAPRVMIRIAA